MQKDSAGRFEFRIFGTALGDAHEAIKAVFPEGDTQTLNDVYLIGADPTQSFKLREGNTLELKFLRCERKRLQQWVPGGKITLPATGRRIRIAFNAPDVMPGLSGDQVHDAETVLSAFGRCGYRCCEVAKRRTVYASCGNRAEFVQLTIDRSDVVETVAVENDDPDVLARLLGHIGLEYSRNVSYPQYLLTQSRIGS